MKNPMILLSTAFADHPLTALEVEGRPAFIAREVGTAIGYSHGGKRFTNKLTTVWKDDLIEGTDYALIDGQALGALRELAGPEVVPAKARSLVVLFQSGLLGSLLKTRKPMGVQLRRFLVDEVLPQLVRTGSYQGGEVVELEARRAMVLAEAEAQAIVLRAKAVVIHAQATKLEANANNNRSIASKHRARAKLLVAKPTTMEAPDVNTRPDDWFYKQEICFHLGLVTKGKGKPRYAVLNKALQAVGLYAVDKTGKQDKPTTQQLIDVAVASGRAAIYSKTTQGRKGTERREVICFAPVVTEEVRGWLEDQGIIEPVQKSMFRH